MFSVNINKLVEMTEKEGASYDDVAETLLQTLGSRRTLAFPTGGLNAFKTAYKIMQHNYKVLFIDCDITTDVFVGKYKLGKDLKGVADFICAPDEADNLLCMTGEDDLSIMFSGDVVHNPISSGYEQGMKLLLDTYLKKFDYIIMDSDREGNMAKCCEAAAVFIDEDKYSEESAAKYISELENKGCNVLGVIINE